MAGATREVVVQVSIVVVFMMCVSNVPVNDRWHRCQRSIGDTVAKRLSCNDFFKVLKIFNLKESDINLSSVEDNEFLAKGSKINKIDILFKKIDKNND